PVQLHRQAERAQEIDLGGLHEAEEVGEVDDAGHVGVGELDAARRAERGRHWRRPWRGGHLWSFRGVVGRRRGWRGCASFLVQGRPCTKKAAKAWHTASTCPTHPLKGSGGTSKR